MSDREVGKLRSIGKVRVSSIGRDVFALGLVVLSAYLASLYTISGQRELYKEHAANLQEVIRFEAAQNFTTLERSTVKLRGIASDLRAFIAGEAAAPTVGPGYLGLATVGLRMHLESPNAYYIPHGLVTAYTMVYERLTRHGEVQRGLDTAAIRYAAALTPREKQTAAVALLITIEHQLTISGALISQEGGLQVLLKCLDQFSAGEEICEYKLGETLEPEDHTEPAL